MQKGLLFLASLVISFTCVNCGQEQQGKQGKSPEAIHAKLDSLKVEIELHLANNELDSAGKKIQKLVHPSSEASSINYPSDGIFDNPNRALSTYRYNEYWKMQRSKLMEKLEAKRKN